MLVDPTSAARSQPEVTGTVQTSNTGGGISMPNRDGSGEPVSSSEIMEMVKDVQESLDMMHKVGLQFAVHESSGRVMVKVIDEDSGKVIREIPPKEILNLAAKFDEMIGMIFDQKG